MSPNLSRSLALAAVVAAIALIAVITLTPEQSAVQHHNIRILAGWTVAHIREDLLNSLLFAPLGLSAAAARFSPLRTFLLSLGCSVLVELLQRFIIPGRFAELQDVVFNTAGAMIAYACTQLALRFWHALRASSR